MTTKARRAAHEYLNDAAFMRKFHGWGAIIWLIASFPICIFLATWVPIIVFMSAYAIVTGHWSSWQAARVEEKQDIADGSVGSE